MKASSMVIGVALLVVACWAARLRAGGAEHDAPPQNTAPGADAATSPPPSPASGASYTPHNWLR